MTRALALVALLSPGPAAAQEMCYRLSDCACAAAQEQFLTGAWTISVAPGVFGTAGGFDVPFNPDSGTVDIVSTCDGALKLGYTDREMGPVGWNLQSLGDDVGIDDIPRRLPDWPDFVFKSPELLDFTDPSLVYMGETTFELGQGIGAAPAMMVLAYAPDPGNGRESGVASITMRIGPVVIDGYGRATFWARTGPATFTWAGHSVVATRYVRTRCRCDEVESGLREQQAYYDAYARLLERVESRGDGLIPVGTGQTLAARERENAWATAPPMRNLAYDAEAPLDPSGNWPCVPAEGQVTEGETIWESFQRLKPDIDAAVTADDPEVFLGRPDRALLPPADASVAGEAGHTELDCTIHVHGEEDYCRRPEIMLIGTRNHEEVHAATCRARLDARDALDERLSLLEAGGATERALAAKARDAGVLACEGVEGDWTNSISMLRDEMASTRADLNTLSEYVGQYCQR